MDNLEKEKDWEHDLSTIIDSLKEIEGDEFVSDIMGIFLSQIDKDIDKLEGDIENKQLDEIADKAHFYFSTFSIFNFLYGIDLVENIQRKFREKKSDPKILEMGCSLKKYLCYLKIELSKL